MGELKNIPTKAYVVDSKDAPFVLRDVILDGAQENELLVEIKYTGICHTVGKTARLEGVRVSNAVNRISLSNMVECLSVASPPCSVTKELASCAKLDRERHSLPGTPSYCHFTRVESANNAWMDSAAAARTLQTSTSSAQHAGLQAQSHQSRSPMAILCMDNFLGSHL